MVVVVYVDRYGEYIYLLNRSLQFSHIFFNGHSSRLSYLCFLWLLAHNNPTLFNANTMRMKCKPRVLPMPTSSCISHTRLHISRRWILQTSFVALSLLSATHPCALRHGGPSPPLVRGWHHWLGSTWSPRASTASYNAAKDRK